MTLYSKKNHVEWSKDLTKTDRLELEAESKIINSRGYIKIYGPHFTVGQTGFIYEHRFVMEQFLGRRLRPYENVHHINEIKVDNRIENLYLTSNSEHTSLHREGKNQSLKRRTNMRKKTRNRRRTAGVRQRDAGGRYVKSP